MSPEQRGTYRSALQRVNVLRWWDTKKANDGGVMHDASMRDWTIWAAGQRTPTKSKSLREVLSEGAVDPGKLAK